MRSSQEAGDQWKRMTANDPVGRMTVNGMQIQWERVTANDFPEFYTIRAQCPDDGLDS